MTVTFSIPKLNSVASVKATAETGVFILQCNITDMEGTTYDAEYCSRPDDTFGLNPTIRQWLTDNPSFPIEDYAPPTIEQVRATMQPLTARQLRLGLISNGISPTQVQSTLDAMPAGVDRDKALVEWEYATTFNRMHPLIGTVGTALGLPEQQIDEMWTAALNL